MMVSKGLMGLLSFEMRHALVPRMLRSALRLQRGALLIRGRA
jgi:hypothetical protein